MTHEAFFDQLSQVLEPHSMTVGHGEEFREPPLDVLRYHTRRVRLHWFPVLGRALSVVAVVKQPPDVSTEPASLRELVSRVSRAVDGRFPPWPSGGPGLVIGLTTLVLSSDPIGPEDEQRLALSLPSDRKYRIVPLGLFRINLEQSALSFAIGPTPVDVFPEPITLGDGLSTVLGRFVPPLDLD